MEICYNLFPGGKMRCLSMSFDDSCLPQNERLIRLFNRYGIKATFHLNGRELEDAAISVREFRELYEGHEISCHGYHHTLVGLQPKERILCELISDRRTLEKYAGYPIRSFSYPYGSLSPEALEAIHACNFDYARMNLSTGTLNLPTDYWQWNPTHRIRDDHDEMFAKFMKGTYLPRLYYIMGHAHELSEADWDKTEAFCEKAAQNGESIWFATGIEIIDYLKAQRALRFTVDCDCVYNPTCTTVWIRKNGEPTEITPGLHTL